MPTTVHPLRRKLSVPMVAHQLGVSPAKVLDWVKTGELRAINLARRPSNRPRYAVDVEDLASFERARQVVPSDGQSGQQLRRRKPANVKEFF